MKPAFQSLFYMAIVKESSGVIVKPHGSRDDDDYPIIEDKTTPPG